MTTETPRRAGPLIAAGLLVFVGFVSLCAQFCSQRTADDADWQRAADRTVELAEPTDAIRVAPSWSEAPLPHLGPVGNLLHRHHDPLLEDFLDIDRVLIITEARRISEAVERLPFAASPDEIHDFGTIELVEVTIPEKLRLTSDLTDLLEDATVAYETPDGTTEPCRFRARRNDAGQWRCDGSQSGARVGPILLEVEDDPRRCIQAYPPSGDRFLSVETTVEDTSDLLRIRAGLDNRAARLEGGGDVQYRLFVDGEQVADEYVDGHTSRWTPHDAPTEAGRPVDLRVEVESVADEPHHRRFCFNAWPMTDEQARK